MNNNGLITCQNCESIGRVNVLGSITPQGFNIMRINHSHTVVLAKEYQIRCDCGFTLFVAGTVITRSFVQPYEERSQLGGKSESSS